MNFLTISWTIFQGIFVLRFLRYIVQAWELRSVAIKKGSLVQFANEHVTAAVISLLVHLVFFVLGVLNITSPDVVNSILSPVLFVAALLSGFSVDLLSRELGRDRNEETAVLSKYGWLISGVGALVLLGVFLWAVRHPVERPLPSPYLYSQSQFESLNEEVCVGGSVLIPLDGLSDGETRITLVAREIEGKTAAGEGLRLILEPLFIPSLGNQEGVRSVPFTYVLELPENVPPGMYKYTHGNITVGGEQAAVFETSLFTVVNCDQ